MKREPTSAIAIAVAVSTGLHLDLCEATERVYVPSAEVMADTRLEQRMAPRDPHPEYTMPRAPINYSIDAAPLTMRTTLGSVTVSVTHPEPVQLPLPF